ncbi:hypothetical protein PR003_g17989 [Phytophthora rubi]|uniref:Uncharacterized protein n=1 Tax=Phytophthora rubi TaxID=129364 RepID=A0A6A4E9E8_9STRA|nr:hypothetical protein PR003_g17989 [Phytophthora rubi]
MIRRYKRIRDDTRQIDVVEEFIPTGATHKKVVGILEHLKKLDSVCNALQDDKTSMADVRVLFDQVIDDYPVMVSRLRSNAKIVEYADL